MQQAKAELLLFELQRKCKVLSIIVTCHVTVMTLFKQYHISESSGFRGGVAEMWSRTPISLNADPT
jgi:hypothetical protein